MDEDIVNLFFKEKTLKIFLHTKEEEYATKIRDKAVCMYSYVITTLRKFEELGLVTSKKEGRIKRYSLTKKGKKLDKNLRDLLDTTKNT